MKKDRFMKGTFLGVLVLMGMLVSVSCQDDVDSKGHASLSGRILFSVGGKDAPASRSVAGSRNSLYLMCVGKDSLFISMTEEGNVTAMESRGASLTDDNLASFHLAAYEDDGTEWASGSTDGQSILKDGESDMWMFNPDRNWPEDYRALHFHGYAATLDYGFEPVFSIEGTDRKVFKGTFDYTLPQAAEDGKDAEKQPDLIVAVTPNQNRKVDVVDIDFYHALSAVIFQAGDMPENTRLESITLQGVNSTGTCTYSIAEDGLSFDWRSAEPQSYTQTFGSILEDGADITTTGSEAAFRMIPQTFSDGASIEVKVVVDEGDYQRSYTSAMKLKTLIKGVTRWEAHRKYTYTLSLKEGVTVDVADRVSSDGKTKDGVVITNTGESTSYIRAAIVGHWVSEAGIILSPWNMDDTATGTFAGLQNGDWLQGDDGFFYHKAPVKPGNETAPLFDEYKLKNNAPIIGAVLEFNIVVQAVHQKQLEHAGWPVTASDNGELSLNN